MLELVQNASVAAVVQRQVVCSNHLVHGRAVAAKGKGVVISLTNWAGVSNLTALNVTVTLPAFVKPGMKASLASGGQVRELAGGTAAGGVRFALDLSVADALILR